MRDINKMRGMPWLKAGTLYNAQLGLPDKVRIIIGLVVCNCWDLKPLDLLIGLALGCVDCLGYAATKHTIFLNKHLLYNILLAFPYV